MEPRVDISFLEGNSLVLGLQMSVAGQEGMANQEGDMSGLLEKSVASQGVDLSRLLRMSLPGREWLGLYRKLCGVTRQQDTPLRFSMESLPLPLLGEVSLRILYALEELGDQVWEGSITTLPDTMWYGRIDLPIPPKRPGTLELMAGMDYVRQAVTKGGRTVGCSVREDPELLGDSVTASVLGELDGESLEIIQGNFEGEFPIKHVVRAVYTPLERARGVEPLSIEVSLIQEN